jgi:hypothetical protein
MQPTVPFHIGLSPCCYSLLATAPSLAARLGECLSPQGAPEATKPAFVFSTSGLPFLAKLWHGPLKKLLARKGFEVVGEFSCRGFDTWGPLWLTGGLNWRQPNERDLARAREFAGRVIKTLR